MNESEIRYRRWLLECRKSPEIIEQVKGRVAMHVKMTEGLFSDVGLTCPRQAIVEVCASSVLLAEIHESNQLRESYANEIAASPGHVPCNGCGNPACPFDKEYNPILWALAAAKLTRAYQSEQDEAAKKAIATMFVNNIVEE